MCLYPSRVRTTRNWTNSCPLQVVLLNLQTLSHNSSLVPWTCDLCNDLLSSSFQHPLTFHNSNPKSVSLISSPSPLRIQTYNINYHHHHYSLLFTFVFIVFIFSSVPYWGFYIDYQDLCPTQKSTRYLYSKWNLY